MRPTENSKLGRLSEEKYETQPVLLETGKDGHGDESKRCPRELVGVTTGRCDLRLAVGREEVDVR